MIDKKDHFLFIKFPTWTLLTLKNKLWVGCALEHCMGWVTTRIGFQEVAPIQSQHFFNIFDFEQECHCTNARERWYTNVQTSRMRSTTHLDMSIWAGLANENRSTKNHSKETNISWFKQVPRAVHSPNQAWCINPSINWTILCLQMLKVCLDFQSSSTTGVISGSSSFWSLDGSDENKVWEQWPHTW